MPSDAAPVGFEPLRGRCLCGALTLEATQPAHVTLYCHSADCRRWTGRLVGLFDDPSRLPPALHAPAGAAAAWLPVDDGLPCHTGSSRDALNAAGSP